MSFYVTLPSNSSLETHPDNTGGRFTTILQTPLNLDTTWEVGLAEAVYHRDWPNVRDKDNEITVEYLANWSKIKEGKAPKLIQLKKQRVLEHERSMITAWMVNDSSKYQIENIDNVVIPEGQSRFQAILESLKFHMVRIIENVSDHQEGYFDFNINKDEKRFEIVGHPTPEWKIKLTNDPTLVSHSIISVHFSHRLQTVWGLLPEYKIPILGTTPYYIDLSKGFDLWPSRKNLPKEKLELVTQIFKIKPQRYVAPVDLVDAINTQFKTYASFGELSAGYTELPTMDPNQKKRYHFTLKVNPNNVDAKYWWRIHISPALRTLLGLSEAQFKRSLVDNESYITQSSWKAHHPPLEIGEVPDLPLNHDASYTLKSSYTINMGRDMDSLWVYSDIIEKQVTGSTTSPLLRILPALGRTYGESVVVRYDKPHYFPLAEHTIQSVGIAIYDSFGRRPVPFQQPIVLTLHFRKL